MPPMDKNDLREALNYAIKEWLDEKFAEFGVFSAKALAAALFAAAIYFILHQNGWSKTP